MKSKIDDFQAEIKQLKKENEELKKQYNCYACDSCAGKEDYRNMKRHCENAIKTVHKYNNALVEIRKWVTNHNPCDIEADINYTKEDCFECLNYDIKKITKIINEVLNDRD